MKHKFNSHCNLSYCNRLVEYTTHSILRFYNDTIAIYVGVGIKCEIIILILPKIYLQYKFNIHGTRDCNFCFKFFIYVA